MPNKIGTLRRLSEMLQDRNGPLWLEQWGENAPSYTRYLKQRNWDPELSEEDAIFLAGYGNGSLWQWNQGSPSIDRFNELVHKHGIGQNDFLLWRGLELPRKMVEQFQEEDFLTSHRPSSASMHKDLADEFANLGAQRFDDDEVEPVLIKLHPTGEMVLPIPITGQSEMVLPAGEAGRIMIDRIKQGRWNTEIDGFVSPPVKKAKGGKVKSVTRLAKEVGANRVARQRLERLLDENPKIDRYVEPETILRLAGNRHPIASISPEEYLHIVSGTENPGSPIQTRAQALLKQLKSEQLRETPFVTYELFNTPRDTTGIGITSHDGRARATALGDLGLNSIPVQFENLKIPRGLAEEMGWVLAEDPVTLSQALKRRASEAPRGAIARKLNEIRYVYPEDRYHDYDGKGGRTLSLKNRAFAKGGKVSKGSAKKSFPALEITPEVAERVRKIGVPIWQLGGVGLGLDQLIDHAVDEHNSEPQTFSNGGTVNPQQRLQKIRERHYAEGGKVGKLSRLVQGAREQMGSGDAQTEARALQQVARRLRKIKLDASHRNSLQSALLSAQDAAAEPGAPGSKRRFASSRDEFLDLAEQAGVPLLPEDLVAGPINPLNPSEGYSVLHKTSGEPLIGSKRVLTEEEVARLIPDVQDWLRMTPEEQAQHGANKVGPHQRFGKGGSIQYFSAGGLMTSLFEKEAAKLGYNDPDGTGAAGAALKAYGLKKNAKGLSELRRLAAQMQKVPSPGTALPTSRAQTLSQVPAPRTSSVAGGSSAPPPVPQLRTGINRGAGILGSSASGPAQRVGNPANIEWWMTYGMGPEHQFFTGNSVNGSGASPSLQNPLPGLGVPGGAQGTQVAGMPISFGIPGGGQITNYRPPV